MVIFANDYRVILLKTIMFTDYLNVQNWEKQNSTGVAKNYFLSDLFVNSLGIVLRGDGSSGSLSISPDGKSVTRDLMVCIDGCDMPANNIFEITIVPGRKVFFKDKKSNDILENIIINADHDAIVLYEKESNIVTVWRPI